MLELEIDFADGGLQFIDLIKFVHGYYNGQIIG